MKQPCVCACVLMYPVVCLCVVVFHMVQRPCFPGCLLFAAPVFVPVFLHGAFRALVAGRSDATSALDPGLGSVLGCFTSAVELFQQTSIMWAQTVNNIHKTIASPTRRCLLDAVRQSGLLVEVVLPIFAISSFGWFAKFGLVFSVRPSVPSPCLPVSLW